MKIDRRLNLVFEIDQGDGKKLYAHSTPIEETTWEQHYSVLSKTLTSLYSDDFNPGMAARLTLLRLREVAREKGKEQETESGLITEIERRTNVIALDPEQGWQAVPLTVAVSRDLLSQGDYKEALSYACFFTSVSWVHTKGELMNLIIPMLKMYSAQVTSSNATEFSRSLPTSTPAASTGEKEQASSIPI